MDTALNKPLCAITGARGYVGSCLKQGFAQRGWDVLELTRRPEPGVRAVAFQLGTAPPPEALAGVKALVHCAYDFAPRRWAEIQEVNVEGTRKLLAAATRAGVERIVCISSISAYDGCRSLYGRAKQAVEQLAFDSGALAIRPGLVYGNHPRAMFGKLVERVRKSSVLPLVGDGSQIQFLVHEEDLAAGVVRDAEGKTSRTARLLTAADERPWTFRELLQEIARGLNKKVRFVPVPWRLIWAGLKMVELAGARPEFRSDSLVSLMHQNPKPDFSGNAAAGLVCRPFDVKTLRL